VRREGDGWSRTGSSWISSNLLLQLDVDLLQGPRPRCCGTASSECAVVWPHPSPACLRAVILRPACAGRLTGACEHAEKNRAIRDGTSIARRRRPRTTSRFSRRVAVRVSRCYTPGASISSKTRAKIVRRPTRLATGRMRSPAPDHQAVEHGGGDSSPTSPTWRTPSAVQLNQRLVERGMHLLLFTLSSERNVAQVLEEVWQYRVDGWWPRRTSPTKKQIEGLSTRATCRSSSTTAAAAILTRVPLL